METKKTHLAYGTLTALAIIIVSLVLYLLDMSMNAFARWLPLIILLVGVILNAMAFSKANNAYVSFGQVFSSGFKACAIITLIGIVWAVLSITIFPEMKDRAMEAVMESMQQQNLSDEQIDQAISITDKYFMVTLIAGTIGNYMIGGAIASLIGAAIAKKNKRPLEPQV